MRSSAPRGGGAHSVALQAKLASICNIVKEIEITDARVHASEAGGGREGAVPPEMA